MQGFGGSTVTPSESTNSETLKTESFDPNSMFVPDQRVHFAGDFRRIGTVKYVGPVQGYSGQWVGVDWDNGDGKHDGSVNGVRYFQAASAKSASFVRPQNLSAGFSVLEALYVRYRGESTKEEEDEMYVLSATNKKVSVQLLGKDKIQKKLSHFDEMTNVSLAFLGVSSPGVPGELSSVAPKVKALDLTGNLLSEWKLMFGTTKYGLLSKQEGALLRCRSFIFPKYRRVAQYIRFCFDGKRYLDVDAICHELLELSTLNLSCNVMSQDITCLPVLKNIRILVLSFTGIKWAQMELLKSSLPVIEELHLAGNKISEITTVSTSSTVKGFDSLHTLDLEENCISDWNEILKLCHMPRLKQLYLNKNNINCISYPPNDPKDETTPFQNLECLLLGANNIEDVHFVDSLNAFPRLRDIRLTENPISDPGKGGIPRFVLIARLAKVEVLNGSEVSPRERKESEIRYVRLVMSKLLDNLDEISRQHPRFFELRRLHHLEEERPSNGATGLQKMATSLLSVTLKCVGASMGEKMPLTKKLPATTSVGKLKILCESFFKLKSVKLKLLLQEEGSPFPTLFDDEMASLLDAGVGQESTILVDEES